MLVRNVPGKEGVPSFGGARYYSKPAVVVTESDGRINSITKPSDEKVKEIKNNG